MTPPPEGTDRLRQRIAAGKGNGHENGVHADVSRPGDQGRHRLVGADHDDRFGTALAQIQQRRFHRSRIPRVQTDRHRLHAAPFQCEPGAAITVAAEGIVLVQDGDTLDSQVGRQAGDHFFGFLAVRGPQVDHVPPGRIAQKNPHP